MATTKEAWEIRRILSRWIDVEYSFFRKLQLHIRQYLEKWNVKNIFDLPAEEAGELLAELQEMENKRSG